MAFDHDAVQDLQTRVREWTRQHVRAESLEEAEWAAVEVSRRVGQAVAEEALAATAGPASYEGCRRPCACGRKAKFMDYRPRTLVTLVGEVEVVRAYYYCRHCRSGIAPWDQAQGLSERGYSPGVKATVSEVVGHLTYGETVELLARLTPLRLEESAAEWMVHEVGGRVRQAQAAEVQQSLSGLAPEPGGPPVERLYVAMDGSSAHIDGDWHEVKTGAIYEPQPGEKGIEKSGPKRYVSAQETAEAFTARLYVAASQAGVERAQEVVVIGDGAAWIWNHAEHHYPRATQIVDYWHACQYLWDLAKAQYGEGSPPGIRWAHEHCARLKEHGPARLRRALRRMKPRSPEAAERLRRERGYFTDNAARMRYPEFRARGLMIGSGVVEAACKVVVGQRLKRAGLRWKHRGADCVLALRCLVLNRQYDDLRRFAQTA